MPILTCTTTSTAIFVVQEKIPLKGGSLISSGHVVLAGPFNLQASTVTLDPSTTLPEKNPAMALDKQSSNSIVSWPVRFVIKKYQLLWKMKDGSIKTKTAPIPTTPNSSELAGTDQRRQSKKELCFVHVSDAMAIWETFDGSGLVSNSSILVLRRQYKFNSSGGLPLGASPCFSNDGCCNSGDLFPTDHCCDANTNTCIVRGDGTDCMADL